MKRDDLYKKLRHNTTRQYDMPEMNIPAIQYDDALKQFVEMSRKVGAEIVEVSADDDINDVIRRQFPDAKIFASNLPEIHIAQINPDTASSAQQLNGTDVGIIRGELGVAENGCIWIPQTMKERVVCFISEYLVVLLKKKNIVNNMHEAYSHIEMPEYGYGCFMSGPSKTADIEQALVMGAQAARGVCVLLLP